MASRSARRGAAARGSRPRRAEHLFVPSFVAASRCRPPGADAGAARAQRGTLVGARAGPVRAARRLVMSSGDAEDQVPSRPAGAQARGWTAAPGCRAARCGSSGTPDPRASAGRPAGQRATLASSRWSGRMSSSSHSCGSAWAPPNGSRAGRTSHRSRSPSSVSNHRVQMPRPATRGPVSSRSGEFAGLALALDLFGHVQPHAEESDRHAGRPRCDHPPRQHMAPAARRCAGSGFEVGRAGPLERLRPAGGPPARSSGSMRASTVGERQALGGEREAEDREGAVVEVELSRLRSWRQMAISASSTASLSCALASPSERAARRPRCRRP